MALLKSKAAKAAAMTDATRILEAAPASAQGSAADWSISQLSALYTEHRTQLVSQARRITRDEAEANEVVQEAFLKFMLAAPELDSADRAIAYLRTSVTNLSLNIIRARGARPNLVAIDADTTQERLNEIASENHIDLDTSITAAEDAAIIREALSRLTSDQRTALVMWEMEGRTTEEIATALNTSPANVRHILVRARKSMVRVLEEWVVDDATGLTALNALSTTYKKAAQIAQKSSKAALSLLLVITAFLGFLYSLYIIILKLFMPDTHIELGWASLIICILLLGGTQLLALGMIGEYLGRIHDETKYRPLYVIEDIYRKELNE